MSIIGGIIHRRLNICVNFSACVDQWYVKCRYPAVVPPLLILHHHHIHLCEDSTLCWGLAQSQTCPIVQKCFIFCLVALRHYCLVWDRPMLLVLYDIAIIMVCVNNVSTVKSEEVCHEMIWSLNYAVRIDYFVQLAGAVGSSSVLHLCFPNQLNPWIVL